MTPEKFQQMAHDVATQTDKYWHTTQGPLHCAKKDCGLLIHSSAVNITRLTELIQTALMQAYEAGVRNE